MLIVVISRTEPYLNGAILIKEMCLSLKLECKIVYIEDISFNYEAFSSSNSYTFYFLSNVASIPRYADDFERSFAGSVINKGFFISEMNKFTIQTCLRDVGVNVPKSIELSEQNFGSSLQGLKLPVYLKSQKQADIVIRASTMEEFNQCMIKQSTSNFYIEESVDLDKFHLEKIYYINKYIESKNLGFVVGVALNKILRNISNALKLEVYSADIFVSNAEDDYVCIDINPSSGFFNSTKARRGLVEYVLERLAKNKKSTSSID